MIANHILTMPPRRAEPEQTGDPVRPQPFSSVTTSTLVAIVRGDLDAVDAAAFELQARCRDMSGDYVGLKESTKAYQRFTAPSSAEVGMTTERADT